MRDGERRGSTGRLATECTCHRCRPAAVLG
jgi:hypothetical protein